eukprot:1154650-Pelagomonas_calceolata.AAC.4
MCLHGISWDDGTETQAKEVETQNVCKEIKPKSACKKAMCLHGISWDDGTETQAKMCLPAQAKEDVAESACQRVLKPKRDAACMARA